MTTPISDRITYHACVRYLERVLGLPIPEKVIALINGNSPDNRRGGAEMACALHGLTVAHVRQMILAESPMIGMILAAGFNQNKITKGDFVYVINNRCLATILHRWMHEENLETSFKTPCSRNETRRESHKQQRRTRKTAREWA
jgi:hypothetical protein